MTQKYDGQYALFPNTASPESFEGSVKRFKSFPTPQDVFTSVMAGLPKVFPLTGEPITVEYFTRFLESAITQLEMDLGCYFSETVLWHSEPIMEGLFTSNQGGINLNSWPATRVVSVQLKYGHTNLESVPVGEGLYDPTAFEDPNFPGVAYQYWTIPRPWIFMKRNKVNILPSGGQVPTVSNNAGFYGTGYAPFGGGGYNLSSFRIGAIEVVFVCGFPQDKLPSSVWDLIVTTASYYALMDILPLLFMTSSVSDAIDGVSQSATIIVPQYLTARLQGLDQKRKDLANAFKKQFGRSFGFTHFGS